MDQQLKQRVVGAVILVSMAVVLIPLILRGPPSTVDPARGANIALSPQPSGDAFSSRIVPLASSLKPSRTSTEGFGLNAETTTGDEPPLAGASAGRAAPIAAKGWAVQLGSFSNAQNALALRDRLKTRGYKAFVESVTQNGRKITRVMVGPERDKSRALKALSTLRQATSLDGLVVQFPQS